MKPKVIRKPSNRTISYSGFTNPQSPEELQYEILGLSHAISMAQERIAKLKQIDHLVKLASDCGASDIGDLFEHEDNNSK